MKFTGTDGGGKTPSPSPPTPPPPPPPFRTGAGEISGGGTPMRTIIRGLPARSPWLDYRWGSNVAPGHWRPHPRYIGNEYQMRRWMANRYDIYPEGKPRTYIELPAGDTLEKNITTRAPTVSEVTSAAPVQSGAPSPTVQSESVLAKPLEETPGSGVEAFGWASAVKDVVPTFPGVVGKAVWELLFNGGISKAFRYLTTPTPLEEEPEVPKPKEEETREPENPIAEHGWSTDSSPLNYLKEWAVDAWNDIKRRVAEGISNITATTPQTTPPPQVRLGAAAPEERIKSSEEFQKQWMNQGASGLNLDWVIPTVVDAVLKVYDASARVAETGFGSILYGNKAAEWGVDTPEKRRAFSAALGSTYSGEIRMRALYNAILREGPNVSSARIEELRALYEDSLKEFIGRVVFDPINVLESGIGAIRHSSAIARHRELMSPLLAEGVRIPKGLDEAALSEFILKNLAPTSQVEQWLRDLATVKGQTRAASGPVEKFMALVAPRVKDTQVYKTVSDASQMAEFISGVISKRVRARMLADPDVVARGIKEGTEEFAKEYASRFQAVMSLVAENMVKLASDNIEEVRAAAVVLEQLGLGRVPTSRSGRTLGLILRRMVTDNEGNIGDISKALRLGKIVSPDDVSRLWTKKMHRVLEELIPTPSWEKSLSPVRGVLRKRAALDRIFSRLFMGMNIGYAVNNMASNLMSIAMVGYSPFASLRAKEIAQRVGARIFAASRGIGAAEEMAKPGITTIGLVLGQRGEQLASEIVVGQAFERAVNQLSKDATAIIFAQMPDDLASVFKSDPQAMKWLQGRVARVLRMGSEWPQHLQKEIMDYLSKKGASVTPSSVSVSWAPWRQLPPEIEQAMHDLGMTDLSQALELSALTSSSPDEYINQLNALSAHLRDHLKRIADMQPPSPGPVPGSLSAEAVDIVASAADHTAREVPKLDEPAIAKAIEKLAVYVSDQDNKLRELYARAQMKALTAAPKDQLRANHIIEELANDQRNVINQATAAQRELLARYLASPVPDSPEEAAAKLHDFMQDIKKIYDDVVDHMDKAYASRLFNEAADITGFDLPYDMLVAASDEYIVDYVVMEHAYQMNLITGAVPKYGKPLPEDVLAQFHKFVVDAVGKPYGQLGLDEKVKLLNIMHRATTPNAPSFMNAKDVRRSLRLLGRDFKRLVRSVPHDLRIHAEMPQFNSALGKWEAVGVPAVTTAPPKHIPPGQISTASSALSELNMGKGELLGVWSARPNGKASKFSSFKLENSYPAQVADKLRDSYAQKTRVWSFAVYKIDDDRYVIISPMPGLDGTHSQAVLSVISKLDLPANAEITWYACAPAIDDTYVIRTGSVRDLLHGKMQEFKSAPAIGKAPKEKVIHLTEEGPPPLQQPIEFPDVIVVSARKGAKPPPALIHAFESGHVIPFASTDVEGYHFFGIGDAAGDFSKIVDAMRKKFGARPGKVVWGVIHKNGVVLLGSEWYPSDKVLVPPIRHYLKEHFGDLPILNLPGMRLSSNFSEGAKVADLVAAEIPNWTGFTYAQRDTPMDMERAARIVKSALAGQFDDPNVKMLIINGKTGDAYISGVLDVPLMDMQDIYIAWSTPDGILITSSWDKRREAIHALLKAGVGEDVPFVWFGPQGDGTISLYYNTIMNVGISRPSTVYRGVPRDVTIDFSGVVFNPYGEFDSYFHSVVTGVRDIDTLRELFKANLGVPVEMFYSYNVRSKTLRVMSGERRTISADTLAGWIESLRGVPFPEDTVVEIPEYGVRIGLKELLDRKLADDPSVPLWLGMVDRMNVPELGIQAYFYRTSDRAVTVTLVGGDVELEDVYDIIGANPDLIPNASKWRVLVRERHGGLRTIADDIKFPPMTHADLSVESISRSAPYHSRARGSWGWGVFEIHGERLTTHLTMRSDVYLADLNNDFAVRHLRPVPDLSRKVLRIPIMPGSVGPEIYIPENFPIVEGKFYYNTVDKLRITRVEDMPRYFNVAEMRDIMDDLLGRTANSYVMIDSDMMLGQAAKRSQHMFRLDRYGAFMFEDHIVYPGMVSAHVDNVAARITLVGNAADIRRVLERIPDDIPYRFRVVDYAMAITHNRSIDDMWDMSREEALRYLDDIIGGPPKKVSFGSRVVEPRLVVDENNNPIAFSYDDVLEIVGERQYSGGTMAGDGVVSLVVDNGKVWFYVGNVPYSDYVRDLTGAEHILHPRAVLIGRYSTLTKRINWVTVRDHPLDRNVVEAIALAANENPAILDDYIVTLDGNCVEVSELLLRSMNVDKEPLSPGMARGIREMKEDTAELRRVMETTLAGPEPRRIDGFFSSLRWIPQYVRSKDNRMMQWAAVLMDENVFHPNKRLLVVFSENPIEARDLVMHGKAYGTPRAVITVERGPISDGVNVMFVDKQPLPIDLLNLGLGGNKEVSIKMAPVDAPRASTYGSTPLGMSFTMRVPSTLTDEEWKWFTGNLEHIPVYSRIAILPKEKEKHVVGVFPMYWRWQDRGIEVPAPYTMPWWEISYAMNTDVDNLIMLEMVGQNHMRLIPSKVPVERAIEVLKDIGFPRFGVILEVPDVGVLYPERGTISDFEKAIAQIENNLLNLDLNNPQTWYLARNVELEGWKKKTIAMLNMEEAVAARKEVERIVADFIASERLSKEYVMGMLDSMARAWGDTYQQPSIYWYQLFNIKVKELRNGAAGEFVADFKSVTENMPFLRGLVKLDPLYGTNPETLIHELLHFAEQWLPFDDRLVLSEYFGISPYAWDRDAVEAFAELGVSYLTRHKDLPENLLGVFERVFDFIRNMIRHAMRWLTKQPAHTIPPEVMAVYDRVLGVLEASPRAQEHMRAKAAALRRVIENAKALYSKDASSLQRLYTMDSIYDDLIRYDRLEPGGEHVVDELLSRFAVRSEAVPEDEVTKMTREAAEEMPRPGDTSPIPKTPFAYFKDESGRIHHVLTPGRPEWLGNEITKEDYINYLNDIEARVAHNPHAKVLVDSMRNAINNPKPLPGPGALDQVTFNTEKALEFIDAAIRHAQSVSAPQTDEVIRRAIGPLDDSLAQWIRKIESYQSDIYAAATWYATFVRNEALLDYPDRRTIDFILQLIFPWGYWYTRMIPKWASSIATSPALWAFYFKLKQAIRNSNVGNLDLPDWARGSLVLRPPGFDGHIYWNIERTFFPVSTLFEVFDDEDRTRDVLGRALTQLGSFGPSPHPLLWWAYAAERALLKEDRDALRAIGYLAPVTRAFASLTGTVLEPWLWIRDPYTGELRAGVGGTKWNLARATRYLSELQRRGIVSPDAAVYAAATRSGPSFEHALWEVLKIQRIPALFAVLTGLRVTPRGTWEDELARHTQRYVELSKQVGSSEAARRVLNDAPWVGVAWMAYDNDLTRLSSLTWDVLRRVPPGDLRRKIFNTAGLTDVMLNKFYEDKGDLSRWHPRDVEALQRAVIDLALKLKSPEREKVLEFEEARKRRSALYREAEGLFPGIQDKQAEYFRIAARDGKEAANAYAAQVGLFKYWDWLRNKIVNDPILLRYYADPEDVDRVAWSIVETAAESYWRGIHALNEAYWNLHSQNRKRAMDLLKQNPQLSRYWKWRKEALELVKSRLKDLREEAGSGKMDISMYPIEETITQKALGEVIR